MKSQCEEIYCSVCAGGKNISPVDSGLNMYKCGRCSHVFKIVPKHKQEKYQDDYFTGTHKNWFNNPNYPLFEFIYKNIVELKGKGPLRILDVGCGNCDFLKYLLEKNPGFELYGIDLIKNEYPGINSIAGDMLVEKIEKKFDVISNLNFIEHVDAPELFMNKMRDCLSPGGIIVTSTVNQSDIIYKIAGFLKKTGINSAYDRLYDNHHLQLFSFKSLGVMQKKCGLDNIVHRKHNYPLKSVDYPESSFMMSQLFKTAVLAIFSLSAAFNNGMLQTSVCREMKNGKK